jgi:hypothetical protein
MTTIFNATGKACLFIVYTHQSLGSAKEYKSTEKRHPQHTCNTTHSLCFWQNSSCSTLCTLLVQWTNLLSMLNIEYFFIASLLPREINKRHLRHTDTASGRERIGKFMVLRFPVSVDGQFVTNPSVKCPHTF